MKLAYYPGCSADSSGIEYGMSMKRTAEILGIELFELDDWNCCGATSAHSTDKMLSLALPARNLAIAEKQGMDMLAPCAACYSRHRNVEHVIEHDPDMKNRIEEIIDKKLEGSTQTLSILDVLANQIGTDAIASKVTQPLTGMKAACYYGCLLVRPVEYTGYDDPEDPQSMDEVMKALGADVLDWSHKVECCGAAMVTSRPDVGNRMLYHVLQGAKESGAECIITACPLCMLNLDMRQAAVEKEYNTKFNMPIYYVTELLAIACGDAPKTVGLDKHFVQAIPYINEIKKRAAEAEAQAKEQQEKKEAVSEDPELLQKKINGMIKAFEKGPEKMAGKLLDDESRAAVLAEIISSDEKKRNKLAELMVSDKDKAAKVADAFVTGELKKRDK